MKLRWVLACALTGCGLTAPSTGTVFSTNVGLALFEVRARHTDDVRVQVLYPSDASGAPFGGPYPAVVFIQGSQIGTGEYFWLAQGLVQSGYVALLPEHLNALPSLAADNGQYALGLAQSPPRGSLLDGLVDAQQVAIGGHSEGGAVAVKVALEGGFRALFLDGSAPDSTDSARLPTLGIPTLAVAGASDCSVPVARIEQGTGTFASPFALVVLDGVTHDQFANSQGNAVSVDCAAGIDLGTAHQRILQASTTFLAHALADGSTGAADLSAIPGAKVTAR